MRAAEADHRGRAWLAHTTAALGRVQRFPKLETLTGPTTTKKARRKRQTPDEIMAALGAILGPPEEDKA
jgi:hypothetical protein